MSSPHLSQQFDHLLQQELDRREFLAYAGAALMGVIGVAGMLKTLGLGPNGAKDKPANTYGSSVYGGKR
jgi:hypothetical protein